MFRILPMYKFVPSKISFPKAAIRTFPFDCALNKSVITCYCLNFNCTSKRFLPPGSNDWTFIFVIQLTKFSDHFQTSNLVKTRFEVYSQIGKNV